MFDPETSTCKQMDYPRKSRRASFVSVPILMAFSSSACVAVTEFARKAEMYIPARLEGEGEAAERLAGQVERAAGLRAEDEVIGAAGQRNIAVQ